MDGTIGRRDQHQPVAQQIAAARRLDQAGAVQVIHPPRVGRNIDVRRGAVFDLPRQRRARGERGGDRAARAVKRDDVLDGVGGAGGGEHHDLGSLGGGRPTGRRGQGGREKKGAHPPEGGLDGCAPGKERSLEHVTHSVETEASYMVVYRGAVYRRI